MSTLETAAVGFYAAVVAAAFLRLLMVTWGLSVVRSLRANDPGVDPATAPSLTIIVPAKDEAAVIERCLRSVLAQDYPDFSVIVVDDRSQDATPAIVQRLASEDSRLRLIQIEQLPEGWTGKTHALHVAQQHAEGNWLLFVDADTLLHPRCATVALADAIKHGVAMESLMPSLEMGTFWERVVQPFAGVCLMGYFPLNMVNDPKRPGMGFANGQFILIRRDAYDAMGGHESVRDKFVEDVFIGRNLKSAGVPIRVLTAAELFSVRMYTSLPAMIRGWSRIFYSSVAGRSWPLYLLMFSITLFSVLGFSVLIGAGAAWLAGVRTPLVNWLLSLAIAQEVIQTLTMAQLYHRARAGWGLWLRQLAVPILLYILWRTTEMCRTKRVEWRGTTYGAELSQGATPPPAPSRAGAA